jgi:hypothetical protein
MWLEWRGAGELKCAHCAEARSIVDWEHRDPIGFGGLTLQFWNWPPLSEKFRAEMSRRLGCRVDLLTGSF